MKIQVKSLKTKGKQEFYVGLPLSVWSLNGGDNGSGYGGNSNFLSSPDEDISKKKVIADLAECFAMLTEWYESEKDDKKYPYQGGYILDYKTRTAYYDEPDNLSHILHCTGNYFKNFVRLNSWSFENGAPTDITIKTINLFFLRAGFYECIVTTKDEIDTKYDRKITVEILPAKKWSKGTYVTHHGSGKMDDVSMYTNAKHFYIKTSDWESTAKSMKSRSYTALPKQVADGQEHYTRSLADQGICNYGASFYLTPKLKFDQVIFEKGDDGKYAAHFTDYPNTVGKGKTKASAIGNLVLNSQYKMGLYVNMAPIFKVKDSTVTSF